MVARGILLTSAAVINFALARGACSRVLRRRSHGLDEFIPEQVLNGLREGDADQLPAPLQELEREMEALPRR